MLEYIDIIKEWERKKLAIYMARVIQTWGSAPRPAGSIMLISENGELAGSVSGGCVESEVARQALDAMRDESTRLLSLGVSDDEAWSVGLSCGGKIQVFLQPVNPSAPIWQTLIANLSDNLPSILVSSLEDGTNTNTLVLPGSNTVGSPLDDSLSLTALAAFRERQHRVVEHKGKQVFIQLFPGKPRLIIIGVAHITVELLTLGKMYGFETIVIDPRGYFLENTVLVTEPDQLFNAYPSEVLSDITLDAYSFCAILSHDPKIDDNALEILLSSDVGYVGALGSRKTHARRIARLLEKGFSDEKISRIHAPIGLNIGARSAKEIALSVMSEIIKVKNQFA